MPNALRANRPVDTLGIGAQAAIDHVGSPNRCFVCASPPVDRAPPVPAPYPAPTRVVDTRCARIRVRVLVCAGVGVFAGARVCVPCVLQPPRVCLTDCALATRGAVAARRAASEGCS